MIAEQFIQTCRRQCLRTCLRTTSQVNKNFNFAHIYSSPIHRLFWIPISSQRQIKRCLLSSEQHYQTVPRRLRFILSTSSPNATQADATRWVVLSRVFNHCVWFKSYNPQRAICFNEPWFYWCSTHMWRAVYKLNKTKHFSSNTFTAKCESLARAYPFNFYFFYFKHTIFGSSSVAVWIFFTFVFVYPNVVGEKNIYISNM